jgi:hypothetical protein
LLFEKIYIAGRGVCGKRLANRRRLESFAICLKAYTALDGGGGNNFKPIYFIRFLRNLVVGSRTRSDIFYI